jgi:hypothetical protein
LTGLGRFGAGLWPEAVVDIAQRHQACTQPEEAQHTEDAFQLPHVVREDLQAAGQHAHQRNHPKLA